MFIFVIVQKCDRKLQSVVVQAVSSRNISKHLRNETCADTTSKIPCTKLDVCVYPSVSFSIVQSFIIEKNFCFVLLLKKHARILTAKSQCRIYYA